MLVDVTQLPLSKAQVPGCHLHVCGWKIPGGFLRAAIKALATHLHVACVGVHVHVRVRGRVWRRGRLMGDLDLTFFPPLSLHWTDAPQDATLLSW